MFPKNTKILIVDDSEPIRLMVKNYLSSLGYWNLYQAEDGVQALQKLRTAYNESDEFQLVVSDWNMPKMKGIDLLKTLKKESHFKKLPFILLTTESEKDQIIDAVTVGVSQYILKPFNEKIFSDKLKSAFQKHYGL